MDTQNHSTCWYHLVSIFEMMHFFILIHHSSLLPILNTTKTAWFRPFLGVPDGWIYCDLCLPPVISSQLRQPKGPKTSTNSSSKYVQLPQLARRKWEGATTFLINKIGMVTHQWNQRARSFELRKLKGIGIAGKKHNWTHLESGRLETVRTRWQDWLKGCAIDVLYLKCLVSYILIHRTVIELWTKYHILY